MPDFEKEFVVECDALGTGLGAIQMQENHAIAYLSQSLKGKALALSAYEKKNDGHSSSYQEVEAIFDGKEISN